MRAFTLLPTLSYLPFFALFVFFFLFFFLGGGGEMNCFCFVYFIFKLSWTHNKKRQKAKWTSTLAAPLYGHHHINLPLSGSQLVEKSILDYGAREKKASKDRLFLFSNPCVPSSCP